MYDVSFPGLGINSLQINDTAFTILGRDIKWYGILITVGMILALLYALNRAKFEKISSDDMIDYALFVIIFGVIGARIYFVLFDLDSYIVSSYDSIWKNIWESFKGMIAIWNGGLAIYGGIIGGILAAIFVSLKKKINVFKFLDIIAPATMIGQAIGRWGNFANQEAFGNNTTLPWGMYSNQTYTYLYRHKAELAEMGITVDPTLPVHPTFLYESLWNIIGFIIIHSIYKKKNYNGQIFLFYVGWYGFGRMIIEGFRTDSLMLGDFRVSQLLAFLTFLASITILFINLFRFRNKKSIDTLCEEIPSPIVNENLEINSESIDNNVEDDEVTNIDNSSEVEENANVDESTEVDKNADESTEVEESADTDEFTKLDENTDADDIVDEISSLDEEKLNDKNN